MTNDLRLRPYQEEALAHIVAERRLVYGDPIGSGKTAVGLSAIPALGSHRALVLAPTYLLDQWVREGGRWVPDLEMILGAGTAAKRAKAREQVWDSAPGSALVLNYESAWRDVDALIGLKFDTLICDEAHRLKNRRTSTYQHISKLARRAPNVLFITGTPITSRAEEAWSYLSMIDHRYYSSFWRWVREHFEIEVTDFHGKVSRPIMLVGEIKKGHEELVREEFASRLLQRPEAKILPDMPKRVEHEIRVTLSPAERKAYDELKRRSWTRVDGALVQTVNEVAKTTRLRQLASEWGMLSAGEGKKHGAKVTATLALLEDLDPRPVLVVAGYKETVRRIAMYSGGLELTGDHTKLERNARLEQFMSGQERILVATQGVISEGVDGLQDVCHTLVMVDRAWTPSANDQTIGRLRRSGQDRDFVDVYYIVAEETLDITVADALQSKLNVIEAVTGGRVEVH